MVQEPSRRIWRWEKFDWNGCKKVKKQVWWGTEELSAPVKLALEYDIDVLWVGFRTTVNHQFWNDTPEVELIKISRKPRKSVDTLWASIECQNNVEIKTLGVISDTKKNKIQKYSRMAKLLLNWQKNSLIFFFFNYWPISQETEMILEVHTRVWFNYDGKDYRNS
jgi:hypothetical protein